MKIVTATLALALAAATSAFASDRNGSSASREGRVRYGADHTQMNRFHADSAAVRDSRASMAVEGYHRPHTHSTNPSHDVHVSGRYVGSDPDATIRATITQEGIIQQR